MKPEIALEGQHHRSQIPVPPYWSRWRTICPSAAAAAGVLQLQQHLPKRQGCSQHTTRSPDDQIFWHLSHVPKLKSFLVPLIRHLRYNMARIRTIV
jgi:hypothetical protein